MKDEGLIEIDNRRITFFDMFPQIYGSEKEAFNNHQDH